MNCATIFCFCSILIFPFVHSRKLNILLYSGNRKHCKITPNRMHRMVRNGKKQSNHSWIEKHSDTHDSVNVYQLTYCQHILAHVHTEKVFCTCPMIDRDANKSSNQSRVKRGWIIFTLYVGKFPHLCCYQNVLVAVFSSLFQVSLVNFKYMGSVLSENVKSMTLTSESVLDQRK